MRLAFLVHKFKLLDKGHVERYNVVYRQQNVFYGSFLPFQGPKWGKLATRSLIPANLMPEASELENLKQPIGN